MPRTFDGGRLRAARQAAGLRLEELAVQIGRSAFTVLDYERSGALPSVEALGRLADALGVPVDQLFTEESARAD